MDAATLHGMLNGRLLPAAELRVSALGDGFMYGHGVFTTIAVRSGRPALWREHYERLARDAEALGLGVAPAAELRARVLACVGANPGAPALKIVVFADDDAAAAGELIVPRGGPRAPDDGWKLLTRRRDADAGGAAVKSLNYLAHLRGRRAAVAAGHDELLWLDTTGRVLEGAATNVFLARGATLLTPAAVLGLLPGVARRVVLERFPEAREAEFDLVELQDADEVFVTNALVGVAPVASIDGVPLRVVNGPVTKRAAIRFAEAVAESVHAG